MLFLCLLFVILANISPFPLLALPGAAGNNTLLNTMETYRRDIVNDPDRVFDLEYLLGATVDDPEIEKDMRSYRKEVAKLPGKFFEIEAKLIKKLEGNGQENETEDATENETEEATEDATEDATEEPIEEATECKIWHLGMNLNPSDGHIMDYLTGWHTGEAIGTPETALSEDFLDSAVWREPASYIAIARHWTGIVDAVKVFKFSWTNIPLLDRFKMMDPGRMVVTEGGPIQESIAEDAQNLADDPIFSVGGDLAFNWVYYNNGNRVVLTGGHLSEPTVNDMNTHGLGNHFACDCRIGTSSDPEWRFEISNIQDSTRNMQGTDHGMQSTYHSGPVYGNYAIFVSEDADSFPSPGSQVHHTIEICE